MLWHMTVLNITEHYAWMRFSDIVAYAIPFGYKLPKIILG